MTRERTETGDSSKNRATAGEKENLPGSTVYFTLLCCVHWFSTTATDGRMEFYRRNEEQQMEREKARQRM